jgi:hypothetical protein
MYTQRVVRQMYRRCAVAASSSSPLPSLLRRGPRTTTTIARAASTTTTTTPRPAAAAAAAATGCKGHSTHSKQHRMMAGLPASLSTHAATGQSASEFLDDAGLLRDQAYVNGKWVNAASEATFAVEGEWCGHGGEGVA